MNPQRGCLTPEVQKIAKEVIGREISTVELRLIPYIQHCLLNSQEIDDMRINAEERKIIEEWEIMGLADYTFGYIKTTKKFWDFMCEVLFYSYVGDSGKFDSADTQPKENVT